MAVIRTITGSADTAAAFADLDAKLRQLKDIAKSRAASELVASTAKDLAGAVRSRGAAVNVPADALEDIFVGLRAKQDDLSALVGLRKRGRSRPFAHGYREWRAGSQQGRYKKGKGKRIKLVAAGARIIGESLATMWEIGTSKRRATPFFRPAVEGQKDSVATRLVNGLKEIVEQVAR